MKRKQCKYLASVCFSVILVHSFGDKVDAAILWGAPVGTNDLVKINTVTGAAVVSGTSPTLNNALTGLTLAEEGASLLYIDNSGGPLYRLNANTGAQLSTHTLSFPDTGGLSYETISGVGSVFLQTRNNIVQHTAFNGPTNAQFSSPGASSPGALGGDDYGRHFVAIVQSGAIREFDPETGALFQNLIPSPLGMSERIAGLAFDGQYLYATSDTNPTLYIRDMNLNNSWNSISLTGVTSALVGLAIAPDPPANTPPTIDNAFLYDAYHPNSPQFVDGDISVPEGTASVTARATVSDAENDDVDVTIGNLAAVTVMGGNGTTSPDSLLSSHGNVDLRDEGVVQVTFDATDGSDDAVQVTREITVTNVAPTMDFLTASYNPTIVLIDDDAVLESGFSVPVGTEVTFAFKIDDPGILDGIVASFDVGGTIFDFGPVTGGTLADSFVYTFATAGDFDVSMSIGDGDGGDSLFSNFTTITAEAAATPEPSSLLLFLFGVLAVVPLARRFRRVLAVD